MIHRLCNPLKSPSFFLFGARGTGKSTLLKSLFTNKNVLYLDLLDGEIFDRLLLNNRWLERQLEQQKYDWVIIDEIEICSKDVFGKVKRLALQS
ncbi:MAG: AAA family ATPase [Bacteriovoracaceae bacterium]|nr:AAA family ATPase [Bacteriovoracaceae bacterium]